MDEEMDRRLGEGPADEGVGSEPVGGLDIAEFFADEETEERERALRVDAAARGLSLPGGVEGRRFSDGRLAALNSPLGVPALGRERPPARPAPIDYLTLLLSLDLYADEEFRAAGPEAVAEAIIATSDADHLLLGLSLINHYLGDRRARDALLEEYRRTLRPSLRECFDSAVDEARERTGGDPVICSRQGVLLAMRAVLEAYPEGKTSIEGEMSLRTVILLVHAVSSRLGASETALDEDTTTFGGAPAGLVMELVRNGLFYEQDDPICVMDRALALYQDHASGVHKVGNLRATPREILAEALGGMSFEEFFALGYALWALAVGRDPNDPETGPTTPAELTGLVVPDDRREAFLERVAAAPDWYASQFGGASGGGAEGEAEDGPGDVSEGARYDYDFLPIQSRPVARIGGHLLVLDETYLLQKFTATGLHYTAHDHEKLVRGNEKDRVRWNGAYGEMLEAMVEDRLRALAPGLIGSRRKQSVYTEEDLWEAYGGGSKKAREKAIDVVLDYGDHVLLFEVYSGQPTIGTCVEGDPEAFAKDTERLVLDKAEQLHATAEHLIADQAALTGVASPPGRKIVPVVVLAGGSYPADAVSRGRVDDLLAERGLLQRPGVVEPLCVLNLGELEMLESLVEAGAKPGPVLGRWKRSDLRNAPFWNHVLRKVNPNLTRPTRVGSRVAEAIQEAVVSLGGGALLQES